MDEGRGIYSVAMFQQKDRVYTHSVFLFMAVCKMTADKTYITEAKNTTKSQADQECRTSSPDLSDNQ